MDVEISPTKRIIVLGADKRSLEDLAWCAATYGMSRLYWVDGYLLCVEVYEKSFEHEIKRREFPISQVCYTSFPKYARVFEVEKGMQIPIVNASDMRIFSNLSKAILKTDENASHM
ncbi:MAG: hypothetical protein AOA65_0281 [Candidatus Bathyarchaeota archaeon BA1]|nr:MAG: hypothetical protein AOA65_0281 [Candidatus Bathyarchaeota archaeon BA1]